MKIGFKKYYWEEDIYPTKERYPTEEEFKVAIASWNINNSKCGKMGLTYSVPASRPFLKKLCFKLKTEIKVGNKINIDRWDGNGVCSTVTIEEILIENERSIIVKCNKGSFKFNKQNFKDVGIEFKWKNKKKYSWKRQYQRWINGNDYFFENKNL